MNKNDFIKCVSELLRAGNIKKPVSIPKQVFHISDDEGNSKDFTIKKTDKSVFYTKDDVATIVDACLYVIQESLKQGEPINFRGFGILGLNYRKPRATKHVNTDEQIIIEGRYVPKFTFGNDLRMCAKIYELSLNDKLNNTEHIYDETDEGGVEQYGD